MLAVYTYIQVLKDRLTPDHGATAVEYGLMVALIAVAIIGAVSALGGSLITLFNDIADTIDPTT